MRYVDFHGEHIRLAFPYGEAYVVAMEKLTVSQAAAELGRPRTTISKWVTAGLLPATRVGREAFIPLAALAALRRTCAHCGRDFMPIQPAKAPRYCGPSCRVAAQNARRKTGRPMGRPAKPIDEAATRRALDVVLTHRRA